MLHRYQLLEVRLRRAEQERERWKDRTHVQGTAGVLAAIDREISAAAAEREAIEQAVGSLADVRLQLLLRLRYVDGLTMEQVADTMHIDLRWAQRLHKRAKALLPPACLDEQQKATEQSRP